VPLPCRSPTTTTRKCPMEAGTPRHGERPCPDARSNRDEPRTEHHLDFHHLTRCHPPRRRAEARNKTEQRETARLIRRPFHPTFQLPWAWPCSCSGSAKRSAEPRGSYPPNGTAVGYTLRILEHVSGHHWIIVCTYIFRFCWWVMCIPFHICSHSLPFNGLGQFQFRHGYC